MSENENANVLKGRSIHPRVVNGVTAHKKVNTAKKKNPATVERALTGVMKHLEVHPNDGMQVARLAKLKELL
jgi:hypothetical protein